MMSKFSGLLLSLLLITSCASGHKETMIKMRQFMLGSQYDEALRVLDESDLPKDKNSHLLYLVEKGLLAHYQGQYESSTATLMKAKDLMDELYTTRVSGKLKSVVTNDNADIYYGEKYEVSMVYFYLSLNYYMESNTEQDKEKSKRLRLQARSEILAWDSFMNEIKIERSGRAVFKEDLLARTFGALVHESQDNQNDKQVALQLYQDASEVLFKNYNLYPSFNSSYESFRAQYENFPKMTREEIEKDYVRPTEHNTPLRNFLTYKILSLTKTIQPQNFNQQVSKLMPSEEILRRVNAKGGQVTFLIHDGLIAEKKAKKIEVPIQFGAFLGFAGIMGLGQNVSFELPYMEPVAPLEVATLQALDLKGNLIAETDLCIVAPLGEMAEQSVNEHSTEIAAATGARVIGKHLAAIAASYVTYKAIVDKNPSMATMVSSLGHMAAVAAINQSEKADTRFWSTLPSNVRMGNMILPKGIYRFQAAFGNRVVDLGEQAVDVGTLKFVMNKKNATSLSRSVAGK